MLVFQLVDGSRRTFQTQRYCFLGSVEDWIEIGKPGKLSTLVKKYVKHLGQDSYTSSWHQYDTTSAPALGGPILPERHGNRVAARKTSHFHASRCLPRHHHSYVELW